MIYIFINIICNLLLKQVSPIAINDVFLKRIQYTYNHTLTLTYVYFST